jgi:hypothetical protein
MPAFIISNTDTSSIQIPLEINTAISLRSYRYPIAGVKYYAPFVINRYRYRLATGTRYRYLLLRK